MCFPFQMNFKIRNEGSWAHQPYLWSPLYHPSHLDQSMAYVWHCPTILAKPSKKNPTGY